MNEKMKYAKEVILENKRNGKISFASKDGTLIVCLEENANKVLERLHLDDIDVAIHNRTVNELEQAPGTSHFNIKQLIIELIKKEIMVTVIDQGNELKQMVKYLGNKVEEIELQDGIVQYNFNPIKE